MSCVWIVVFFSFQCDTTFSYCAQVWHARACFSDINIMIMMINDNNIFYMCTFCVCVWPPLPSSPRVVYIRVYTSMENIILKIKNFPSFLLFGFFFSFQTTNSWKPSIKRCNFHLNERSNPNIYNVCIHSIKRQFYQKREEKFFTLSWWLSCELWHHVE